VGVGTTSCAVIGGDTITVGTGTMAFDTGLRDKFESSLAGSTVMSTITIASQATDVASFAVEVVGSLDNGGPE